VEDTLLKPLATARSAFIKMLGCLVLADCKTVGALLKKKMPLLLSMDPTFVIELQVLEALAGDSGMQMLQDAVLKMMPSKTKPTIVALETVSARLTTLKESNLYKYNGSKGQTSVDVTAANFEQMLQGREPKVEALKSSVFFATILAALPLFCHRVVQTAGTVAKVVHYGEKALEICLKDAILKEAAKTLSFGDLTDLHVYNWLLNTNQKKAVEDLTTKILAGLTSKQATKKATVETKAKGPKGKVPVDSDDSVLSLFV
jgi:hypothetical protein